MTDYTKDAHALPFPEGGNKVAVHSDIQALAVKTGIAISAATLPVVTEDPSDPGFYFINIATHITEDPVDPGFYKIGA